MTIWIVSSTRKVSKRLYSALLDRNIICALREYDEEAEGEVGNVSNDSLSI